MTAQQGKQFLIKTKEDGSEDFIGIAGFRSNGITLNQEGVDISNKDSSGFREMLAGAGIISVSVSGTGVFLNSASETLLRKRFGTNEHHEYEIILPGTGSWKGRFMIESLEFAGDYNNEVNYTLSLSSDGIITFTEE